MDDRDLALVQLIALQVVIAVHIVVVEADWIVVSIVVVEAGLIVVGIVVVAVESTDNDLIAVARAVPIDDQIELDEVDRVVVDPAGGPLVLAGSSDQHLVVIAQAGLLQSRKLDHHIQLKMQSNRHHLEDHRQNL